MTASQQKTILIVEDDRFLSSMYAEKLTLEGFLVCAALDGQDGVNQAIANPPDLILLDVLLPLLDGFSVLKRIRNTAATAHIPVVMLTNLSQPEQVKRALELGANDYLVKAHFVPSEVVAKVHQQLKS